MEKMTLKPRGTRNQIGKNRKSPVKTELFLAPFQGSKSNQLYQELEKVYELEPFVKVISLNTSSVRAKKSSKHTG